MALRVRVRHVVAVLLWALCVPEASSAADPVLLADGSVDFHLAEPKLFWLTQPACIPTIASVGAQAEAYAEVVRRVPSYGGRPRTLYYEEVGSICGQQDLDVLSNLVADDDYVYWMSEHAGGLVRLPVTAHEGDLPELLSSAVTGPCELAQDASSLFVLSPTQGVWRIAKAGGLATQRTGTPSGSVHSLQTDGQYLYWIDAGSLRRLSVSGRAVPYFLAPVIATGVTAYFPEGHRLSHCILNPPECFFTEYVFIAQGNRILRYDNLTGSTTTVYTSPESGGVVHELVSDPLLFAGDLYFFESRRVDCGELLCNYDDLLFRTGRGGGTPDLLYGTTSDLPSAYVGSRLAQNEGALFWQEKGRVYRLPKDAEPLPNLRVTGVEVTQAIQDPANSVRLIQNRRTFVRVFVRSDGAPVPGVTAHLYRVGPFGLPVGDPLVPVNPVGPHLTVQSSPDRSNLNAAFLFELPWDWTGGSLRLRAVLNPFHVPAEPSYADNTWSTGFLAFAPSPRLEVQFVSFGYVLHNRFWWPRLLDDVFQTYSWIRRAYPLSSAPGGASDPSPGFRPNLWLVADDELGSRVDRTDPSCQDLLTPDGDYRNLCASRYTNILMDAMRSEYGVPPEVFLYGMITDAAGEFPRGQACCGQKVSSGPVGTPDLGHWDLDTTYGDWYAGHEIGHTLGRAHPGENADDPSTKNIREGCGHSPSDPLYPYADARISPPSGVLEGFDVGDAAFGLPVRLYPGTSWFDVMSYCDNEWISDYTYEGMYDFMTASPAAGATVAAAYGAASAAGDFLSVYGEIDLSTRRAAILRLRRLDRVGSIPALVDGGYGIRLLGADGAVLADHGFTPEPVVDADREVVGFGQIVPFVEGTARVEIFDREAGAVLGEAAVSPSPPSVTDVHLEGDGRRDGATLRWQATDPDGDRLTFDVFYSRDGGRNFLPLLLHLPGEATPIDTTRLGGASAAVLRVVASDGVHTGYADSEPFAVPAQPPQVRIVSPEDATRIHCGQLLNFVGETFDLQDGSVAPDALVWSEPTLGRLGTGPLFSSADLPVGTHLIRLSATNSLGLTGIAEVTVTVDDDLALPGPRLSVGPPVVNWHVPAGETGLQSAELDLINAGGGSLDWEIVEDVPWLWATPEAGSAPARVTLFADPSWAAPGRMLSTRLVVRSPDPGVAPVTVPVLLAVGDVWRAAGELGVSLRDLARELGRTDCRGACEGDLDFDGGVDGVDVARFLAATPAR
ncbi:MAG: BACON domain-containing carbohydrate-binding protein [Deferrisomatales bacterium]